MTYRQEKRIFYNWLRGKNLLEIYKKRCDESYYSRRLTEYLTGTGFIYSGFYWSATPEGFEFWLRLDMKWRKHLNRKRRKYD